MCIICCFASRSIRFSTHTSTHSIPVWSRFSRTNVVYFWNRELPKSLNKVHWAKCLRMGDGYKVFIFTWFGVGVCACTCKTKRKATNFNTDIVANAHRGIHTCEQKKNEWQHQTERKWKIHFWKYADANTTWKQNQV